MQKIAVTNLEGKWIEFNKPKEKIVEILKRLGFGAIKRNYIAKYSCTLLLALRDEQLVEESVAEQKPIAFSEKLAGDASPSSTTTTCSPRECSNATTEFSIEPEDVDFNQSSQVHKWYIKQDFPMKNFLEMEFVSNGKDVIDISDPNTGYWSCESYCEDDILYCKRTSEQHGVTLFESRVCVMCPDSLKTETKHDHVQFFRWTLVDSKNDDSVISCEYFLLRNDEVQD